MRLYANQLPQDLNKGLKPCYLLFGDEPFQINDCRRQIREKCKQNGFEEFIRLSDDDQFDWPDLIQHCQTMSLFSSTKLIELELTGKLNKEATEILKQISGDLSSETILVVFGSKLESNQTKAAWLKALDKVGCYVPVYEIEGHHLNRWLQQQLQSRNMMMATDAQNYLLDFTAGNLLATSQELDKLALSFNAGTQITVDDVNKYVADQSRYSVFQLMDALWAGNAEQSLTILQRLKGEELEPNIMVWAFQKDLLLLNELQQTQMYGGDVQAVFSEHRVWKNKQSVYSNVANRIPMEYIAKAIDLLSQIDLELKQFGTGCPYSMFAHIILLLNNRIDFDLPLPLVASEALN